MKDLISCRTEAFSSDSKILWVNEQRTEWSLRIFSLYIVKSFNNLSQEEYDKMTMDELIDRCMEDNCDGLLDFHVVEISFD
jgi:hypothetical protein